ncbi:MAG: excinuclease ABC subunit UvrA [Legionella sp.]|nr:excinuclease ABC subunit UvrA [Legionella sp.]
MKGKNQVTAIHIRGAKTHNLQNIDVSLPRNQLTVITGLSGSGKSSLAFDTLYAEGQRRYVESLSSYARQFLSMMDKPDVASIEGLSPAIAIEQKVTSHNPRSTVGTTTEIYDYLRLLYARVGEPHCPKHQLKLHAQTISQMVDHVFNLPEDSKIMLLGPVIRGKKGEHEQVFKRLQVLGYVRVRVNGELYDLDAPPELERYKKHTIEVVVDRLKVRQDASTRLSESFENALHVGDGLAVIASMDGSHKDLVFSSKFACSECGYSLEELEPRLFSFNSPAGACTLCDGLGIEKKQVKIGPEDNPELSFRPCTRCEGTRLRPATRNVLVDGRRITDVVAYPIDEAYQFFKNLILPGAKGEIAAKINQEIIARLGFLVEVGLDYLSLNRRSETLSGGEAQRIRLASQIGSGLVGVMYVLDEPSIGLHQRDNARLLKTLLQLRDLGNTIIVVEHDEEAILAADHVLDIGPGAGIHGGHVVASGTPKDIIQSKKSLTGRYLSGDLNIEVPAHRTQYDAERVIKLEGITCHNLDNVSVDIPIGLMTCITGVSGSGKSSLINDTLYPLARMKCYRSQIAMISDVRHVEGLDKCDKVIDIDQSPIGRTPRSNPATYTGLFTPIRELFSNTPEARARGYKIGRFSFNVRGGRCEACQGDGLIKVEMHFLPDTYVICDVCRGKRYNRETLDVQYKGKNIHEVLEMTIEEACEFFDAVPVLARKCQTLMDVGLSYVHLGQSATTLSGGEAQRMKLARELSKRGTGETLYILDEPTTGLHFHDVKQLLQVLFRLRDQGNTIVVIEHNLDVIKTADWLIDLGPEGGNRGGEVLASGTPEQVALCKRSYTGQFLAPLLA